MAAKKHNKNGRARRNSTQKINAVSKASIRMLSPAYVMGIHSLSDDESCREPDSDDVYGGCETSDSWSDGLTVASATMEAVTDRALLPGVIDEEPRITALPQRSYSSDLPRKTGATGNALGLSIVTDYSRKMSAETVREASGSRKASPIRILPGPAAVASPVVMTSQMSPPTPVMEPTSPNGMSFSKLFSWRRGNNSKQSKTPPIKKTQLASPQVEAKEVPTSAPADVTTFAQSQARPVSPASAGSSSKVADEKQQTRFKAHLNDLYKSYALDNRYISDNMTLLQTSSPPENANMSPYFAMPVSPNYATTPLPHFPKATQRGQPSHRKPAPTLREVRKATPSTIGQQHQAMMAQRYYESSSSLGSYAALDSSPSSTPPRRLPVRGSSASSAIPSSSSSSSSLYQAGSPLRRVTSIGRGTRKVHDMRSAPTFQLLPDFSFNNGPPKAAAQCFEASESFSSLSDAHGSDESDEPLTLARRRGQGLRRRRANSQPKRPPVPEVPAMLAGNALGIEMNGARAANGPPTRPPPPVPSQSGRPAMRRRSKSFDSVVRGARLRPAESLTPTSPLSPTLESLVDDSETFWPDFMTEELNLKRQQTQRNLAGMAPRPSESEVANEESVAKRAQRVTLSSHGQVVGVSSPRIVSISPRLSERGSPNHFASAFRRPTSAMSNTTVRAQSPLLHAEPNLDDRRISTASTIRASSPNNLLGAPVVNVMPPTPDMADEEDGFTTSGPQIIVESASQPAFASASSDALTSYDEEYYDAASVYASEAEPTVAAAVAEQAEPKRQHERNISDISAEGTMSSNDRSVDDEDFGFVRSFSSASLASSSDESDTSSNDDLDAEVDNAVVGSAHIVSVASPSVAPARFSRAQVVLPSMASMASLPSGTSLAMAVFGSPPRNTTASPPRVDQTPGLSCASSASASSFTSSAQQTDNQRHVSPRMASESRDSMASMMTTSTSILDFGSDMVHHDSVFERLNARAFGPVHVADGEVKSPKEEALAAFGELRSPASIQNILNYVNMAAPGGTLSEEDCDTPRLQYSGFNAFFQNKDMPQTRPLNVRKNMSKTSLVDSASSTSYSDAAIPSPAAMAVTQSNPGTRTAATLTPPASKSPYPRDENTQSPNLELDLSKPLDLHNIGLGLEVAQAEAADKPRRRGAAAKAPGYGQRVRSKSNVDQRRPSIQQHVYVSKPGALLESAMEAPETSRARGLGLDLSGYSAAAPSHCAIFGLQDSPEKGYQYAPTNAATMAVRNSSKALHKVASTSENPADVGSANQERRPFQPRNSSNTQRQSQKYQYYSAESYCENGIGFAM